MGMHRWGAAHPTGLRNVPERRHHAARSKYNAKKQGAAPGVLASVSAKPGHSITPPRPHPLSLDFSESSKVQRVCWTVCCRKLQGNDRQLVSPPFELTFGSNHPVVTFRMMILPK